jgi:hypothetical protein
MAYEIGRVLVIVKRKSPIKSRPEPTNRGLLGEVFFDIPVYRLAKENYDSQRASFVQRELSGGGYYVREMYRHDPNEKERWQLHFEENFGGDWLFNEIIGFIRLFFYGTQIRGEYWQVKAKGQQWGGKSKRIVKTRTKIFGLQDLKVTCEEEIPPGTSNHGIFQLVLKYLAHAQNERNLKRRYIDASLLEYIGPHIDWNALVNLAHRSAGETCAISASIADSRSG